MSIDAYMRFVVPSRKVLWFGKCRFAQAQRRPPLSKADLIAHLPEHAAFLRTKNLVFVAQFFRVKKGARKIQSWYRNYLKRAFVIKRALRRMPTNAACPITHCKMDPSNVFKYITEQGVVLGYDALALGKYMLSSKDFRDPITRISYNAVELNRLQKCIDAQEGELDVTSVYRRKNSRTREEIDEEFDMHAGVEIVLEECMESLWDYLNTLVRVCAGYDSVSASECYAEMDNMMMNIVLSHLPEIKINLDLLCTMDPNRAFHVVSRWRRRIWEDLRHSFHGVFVSMIAFVIRSLHDQETLIRRFIVRSRQIL